MKWKKIFFEINSFCTCTLNRLIYYDAAPFTCLWRNGSDSAISHNINDIHSYTHTHTHIELAYVMLRPLTARTNTTALCCSV